MTPFHFPVSTKALAALSAAALYLPGAASAASSLSVLAQGGGPFVPTQTASSGPLTLSRSNTDPSGQGSDRTDLSADFGVLRLYSEAKSLTYRNPTIVQGSGTASWRDDFLIDSTTLKGQLGQVTFSLRIDGNLTGSTSEPADQSSFRSYSNAKYTLFGDGNPVSTATETHYFNNGEIAGDVFLNQTQTFTVAFTFGTPFEMRLEVRSLAVAYGGSTTANAVADLAHTATWGGFSSVTDSQGTPAAYSFSSTSGANFTQAIVPEPGAYALVLLVGAGAFVGFCKRRGMAVSS